MSEIQIEAAEPPKKKSFLGRLLKWSVTLAVLLVIANFIAGLRSDQKEKFVNTTRTNAELRCQGDTACLTALAAKFTHCLEEHSQSHKSGKFSRKYTLDEPGFYSCVR